jgi:hypothetical protein
MMKHGPVEECTSRATVPVHERVIVSQPEVEDDGSDNRVYKALLADRIGEVAHCRHPLVQLAGWRRVVKHLTKIVTDHAILVILAESTGGGRVVKRLVCNSPMQLKDKVSRAAFLGSLRYVAWSYSCSKSCVHCDHGAGDSP